MNATPRQAHLALGPLVATAGALLLIVSLFLDWYDTFTGFTIFEFLDLLLVMLALVTIAALLAALGLISISSVASPGASLAAALVALLTVVSQILNHPPGANGLEKELGIWLGLSGAALMVAGAVLGYAHISLAVETRPRAAPPPAPPSTPPPAGREEPTERL